MVVSLTSCKTLKLQNMFDKMKIDHQHFCKNQNSKSNENGSNVKVDRVENFKEPLNLCTSQTNLETRQHHITIKTFEIVQTNKQVENLPEP